MTDTFRFVIFAGFAISCLAYGYFILRLMIAIPFRSWFPFGIWSLGSLKKLLGPEYGNHVQKLKYSALATFGFALLLLAVSGIKK
jgi:hypothetical protein